MNALDFAELIAEVPYLSDLQREFYQVYLTARREALFNEAYEKHPKPYV